MEKSKMRISFVVSILVLVIGISIQSLAQSNPTPAPVFSDLLANVYLRDKGQFKPSSMYAYFLSGDKGALKVLHNGNEIAEFSFRIEIYTAPRYTIDGFELIKGKNDTLGLMLKKPGQYELVYYSGGTKFYSFPFELEIKDSGDPYKPNKRILLNGAWNDYAYLHRNKNNKWEFRVFMRSDDGILKQTKGQVLMINDKDKKVVAVGSSGFRREGAWRRQDLPLQKPGKVNAKGEYYSNSDLYADRDKFEDGTYTMKFTTDGKLYGSYKLTVKGGEIQLQDRQIRSSTDPTNFIEGGGKEFWLKRQ